MKALTLYQPWASLIAHGVKTIETRSWVRGSMWGERLAIHAGKRVERSSLDPETERAIVALYGPEWWMEVPKGAVVCTALVADLRCVRETDGEVAYLSMSFIPDASPKVAVDPHGDFGKGRWLWFLRDIQRLNPPVPAVGRMGLWEWPGVIELRLDH